MNRHQFQQVAKKFRAGKITLEQFTDQVIASGKNEPKETGRSGTGHSASGQTKKLIAASDAVLPTRAANTHKGDFGRVLVVGGSRGMGGAISLTGMAALRTGSGLVIVATPASQLAQVASFSPCYMTVGMADAKGRFSKNSFDELVDKCEWADIVAIGPGMGRSKPLQKIMHLLYAQLPQPVVVDADGLNNLADSGSDLSRHEGLRVLTPHPGEFQRLDGLKSTTDHKQLESRALRLAAASKVTIVLKGHRTFITDGVNVVHNATGNPGMATAGSGDVLTGVIASLIGQGMSPFEAAQFGVRVHGLAGDLGASELGQASLIATDILNFLPAAFLSLSPGQ